MHAAPSSATTPSVPPGAPTPAPSPRRAPRAGGGDGEGGGREADGADVREAQPHLHARVGVARGRREDHPAPSSARPPPTSRPSSATTPAPPTASPSIRDPRPARWRRAGSPAARRHRLDGDQDRGERRGDPLLADGDEHEGHRDRREGQHQQVAPAGHHAPQGPATATRTAAGWPPPGRCGRIRSRRGRDLHRDLDEQVRDPPQQGHREEQDPCAGVHPSIVAGGRDERPRVALSLPPQSASRYTPARFAGTALRAARPGVRRIRPGGSCITQQRIAVPQERPVPPVPASAPIHPRPLTFIASGAGLIAAFLCLPFVLVLGGPLNGWILGVLLWSANWALQIFTGKIALNSTADRGGRAVGHLVHLPRLAHGDHPVRDRAASTTRRSAWPPPGCSWSPSPATSSGAPRSSR